jgi:hypothetical protein
MRAPCPREMNRGVPPTLLNARTGLFTPPGITRRASAKSRSDLFIVCVFCHNDRETPTARARQAREIFFLNWFCEENKRADPIRDRVKTFEASFPGGGGGLATGIVLEGGLPET